MAVWGGFVNHLRIGLDISTDGYNTYTPSINVYLTWYVQCDPSWNFNDSETLVMTSPQSGSWTFQNTLGPNGIVSFGWTIGGQGQSYGGGPTYHFGAQLNGVYLGAGPTFGYDWALPARPYRAPSPPGQPFISNVQSTSCDISWSDSSDYGGLGPDSTTVHIATDPGMSNIVQDLGQGGNPLSRHVTGLTPGSTYYAQSFSHNGAGWSGGSSVAGFTLLPGAYPHRGGSFINGIPKPHRGGSFVGVTNTYKRRNGVWVIT